MLQLSHLPKLAAALALALSARTAPAQSGETRGVIDGVVIDTALHPLGGATITLLGFRTVVTGPNGRFQITATPVGQYTLLVRHLGFEPASVSVGVVGGDTARISIALERIPTHLGAATVTASRTDWKLAEFEERRHLAEGQFMTRAEIERLNMGLVSDLLTTFRGLGKRGPTSIHGGVSCSRPQVYLDGVIVNGGVDDVAVPADLAAIEVYVGPATIPAKYKPTSRGVFCGVVLLWTRSAY